MQKKLYSIIVAIALLFSIIPFSTQSVKAAVADDTIIINLIKEGDSTVSKSISFSVNDIATMPEKPECGKVYRDNNILYFIAPDANYIEKNGLTVEDKIYGACKKEEDYYWYFPNEAIEVSVGETNITLVYDDILFKVTPKDNIYTIKNSGELPVAGEFTVLNNWNDRMPTNIKFTYSGGYLESKGNKIPFSVSANGTDVEAKKTVTVEAPGGKSNLKVDMPIYINAYDKMPAGEYVAKLSYTWDMRTDEGLMEYPDALNPTGNGVITLKLSIPEKEKKTSYNYKYNDAFITKMTTVGKRGIKLSWNKIKGVDGYQVFFSRCNHDGKVEAKKFYKVNASTATSWVSKKLKKNIAYKAFVKAFVVENGHKTFVKTSTISHAFTGGGNKKYTNAKNLNLKKNNIKVKVGKKAKIKGSVIKLDSEKKLISKRHTPKLRFVSDDKRIATVSKKGVVKAVKAGNCYIYVFTHNGIAKKVKVNVK